MDEYIIDYLPRLSPFAELSRDFHIHYKTPIDFSDANLLKFSDYALKKYFTPKNFCPKQRNVLMLILDTLHSENILISKLVIERFCRNYELYFLDEDISPLMIFGTLFYGTQRTYCGIRLSVFTNEFEYADSRYVFKKQY